MQASHAALVAQVSARMRKLKFLALGRYEASDVLLERCEVSSTHFEGVYHQQDARWTAPYAAWTKGPQWCRSRQFIGCFASPLEAARDRYRYEEELRVGASVVLGGIALRADANGSVLWIHEGHPHIDKKEVLRRLHGERMLKAQVLKGAESAGRDDAGAIAGFYVDYGFEGDAELEAFNEVISDAEVQVGIMRHRQMSYKEERAATLARAKANQAKAQKNQRR